jgi:hypothetical protein
MVVKGGGGISYSGAKVLSNDHIGPLKPFTNTLQWPVEARSIGLEFVVCSISRPSLDK